MLRECEATVSRRMTHQDRLLASVSSLGLCISNAESFICRLVEPVDQEKAPAKVDQPEPTLEQVLTDVPDVLGSYQMRIEAIMKRLEQGLI